MPVRWDAKDNPRGITGLHEILGRDYGIEKPIGDRPLNKVVPSCSLFLMIRYSAHYLINE